MNVAPTDVRSGLPGSGPQTLKSKFGTPSAERSMPNTSQMTPNSNTARPSSTSADTLLIMAVSYRKASLLPLLAGYCPAKNYCHDHALTFLILIAPFAVAATLSWAAHRAGYLRLHTDQFRFAAPMVGRLFEDDARRVRIEHDVDAIRTRFEQQPSWPDSGVRGERR